MAPCAALFSLLAALFGPALFNRTASLGIAPALGAIGLAAMAAFGAGVWACRGARPSAWIGQADRTLALEGRLDAAAAILAGGIETRLCALCLQDAEALAGPLRARDGVRRPPLGRLIATSTLSVLLAMVVTLVPPVRASAPDRVGFPWSGKSDASTSPPGGPAANPEPDDRRAPRGEKPESPPPEPKRNPEPPPPPPEPKPSPEKTATPPQPEPLGPPPPTPELAFNPKFLQPLVDEGPMREKESFTPLPDEGTREAKPLLPEELRRLYPEIRKRAEASLPRQAFSEEERRVVRRYFETLVPKR